jgi:hypothetical protein
MIVGLRICIGLAVDPGESISISAARFCDFDGVNDRISESHPATEPTHYALSNFLLVTSQGRR